MDAAGYAAEIVRSGFPGLLDLSERARELRLDGYLDSIVQREFPDQGLSLRKPAALRRWLAAYGSATATTATFTRILDAATPGEGDKPSRPTVDAYRDVLERLWMLDEVPAWAPVHGMSRLTGAPKHFLADPALAARLLGVGAEALLAGTSSGLREGALLGAFFEHLVALSVQTYAQASGASVHHLRTKGGEHEIDLIVERPDGRVVAIEVKLARTVGDADVRHLHWLAQKVPDLVSDRVVVTAGRFAYRRSDGVAVVPAALLGA